MLFTRSDNARILILGNSENQERTYDQTHRKLLETYASAYDNDNIMVLDYKKHYGIERILQEYGSTDTYVCESFRTIADYKEKVDDNTPIQKHLLHIEKQLKESTSLDFFSAYMQTLSYADHIFDDLAPLKDSKTVLIIPENSTHMLMPILVLGGFHARIVTTHSEDFLYKYSDMLQNFFE